jgi:RHS repeat-associated protein
LKVNGATYATYTYDSINRLTNLADSANLSFNYNYDAANRLTSRSAPNGVTSSYGYDGLDRLISLMHTRGVTTLSGNLYNYNNANNISSWTTQTEQRTYTYDAVDRLTGVANPELPTENYTYDGVGNRTASHLSASYGYQPFNRLASTATATYSYDNNGNLVSKSDALGTWTFGYDEENRLTEINKPGGLTITYKYDGLGRRIQRISSAGANERYVYDGADVLIDLNADWSIGTTYLNGLGVDDHLRQSSGTTGISYFLADHLRSTAGLTDVSGNLVEQLSYDSFGNGGGSARTRYEYTGRERDPDSGMLYYRARIYDQVLGRFTGEDPARFADGVNQFVYVRNNAVRAIDPFGLSSILVVVGARSTGGTGGAYILLLDKNGKRISFRDCDCDTEVAQGRATAKNPNRMLGNQVGDTPFGVYAYEYSEGGNSSSRLGAAFGTGKIRMRGVYGEIIDSNRSLIRLHGGGSNLLKRNPPEDPYDLDQDLLPTGGCVRMKNRDVNGLIQAINNLPKDDPLEFIFIGNADYINGLATDQTQSNQRWQGVLRTNLGIH